MEYSLSIYLHNLLVPPYSLYPYSSSIINGEIKAQIITKASREAVEMKAELEVTVDEDV